MEVGKGTIEKQQQGTRDLKGERGRDFKLEIEEGEDKHKKGAA